MSRNSDAIEKCAAIADRHAAEAIADMEDAKSRHEIGVMTLEEIRRHESESIASEIRALKESE